MSWTYTVSVRSLCEFTAKRGDLDRRFTPSATALEGMNGQAAVAARRGAQYETELPLAASIGHLRVRGRADGYDPQRRCLEEIKTIRTTADEVPDNRRRLHWAQLETYGALFCREREVPQIELALVYVHAATQLETVLRRICQAIELEAALQQRCTEFTAWAAQEAAHRTARDAALAGLPFPPGAFRPGQRGLAQAVFRAARDGRTLLAQAPTGIGKTVGTLYPMLRAMPVQSLDKVIYLTCKGTAREVALEALQGLRAATPGEPLRVLALTSKAQACEHPDKACHAESCPLAEGFYDKLPAARLEAAQAGWLDAAAQRRIARRHGVCPYHLGHELLRWADVVVGDVHHVFDPNGQLYGLTQALDWRVGLLVDEAHNLIDRTRAMYSASIGMGRAASAMRAAPPALQPAFTALMQAAGDAGSVDDENYVHFDEVPDAIADALRSLNAAIAEHLQAHPVETGPVLEFFFESLAMQRLVERFGSHSLFDLERDADGDGECTFSIRNIVPAEHLRARFAAFHTTTLFSATLAPEAYQRDMLGLPKDAAWIDVPSPFPAEHLVVRIAERLSTRFPHRAASLDRLVDLMARQFDESPGNYLAFFSSFAYLDQAAQRLAERHPRLRQWCQSRSMSEPARQAFLACFVPGGEGIGFAVLGGAFAEGVDLVGTRLIGAFIATLGLPPVSPVQQQFERRLDTLFGANHGYAGRVPGLQKVVQAAGRVIRSPSDRGTVWLMDQRFREPQIRALLPEWWDVQPG